MKVTIIILLLLTLNASASDVYVMEFQTNDLGHCISSYGPVAATNLTTLADDRVRVVVTKAEYEKSAKDPDHKPHIAQARIEAAIAAKPKTDKEKLADMEARLKALEHRRQP